MKKTVQRLGPLALRTALSTSLAAALLVASPAGTAASMSASSASDSASSAAGSASDSFQGSSNSSSRTAGMAAGNYEIVQVALVTERPGMLRMTLAAVGDGAAQTHIVLPQEAFAQSRLAPGETVAVRDKPYGLELANAKTQEAFYLVLADSWHQELAARPVQL